MIERTVRSKKKHGDPGMHAFPAHSKEMAATHKKIATHHAKLAEHHEKLAHHHGKPKAKTGHKAKHHSKY